MERLRSLLVIGHMTMTMWPFMVGRRSKVITLVRSKVITPVKQLKFYDPDHDPDPNLDLDLKPDPTRILSDLDPDSARIMTLTLTQHVS